MPDFTWEDYGNNIGNTTGGILSGVVDGAAQAVCELWENNPAGLLSGPLNDAMAGFTAGLADRLCRPRDMTPPDPPPPGFTGGQCQCLPYMVSWVIERGDGPEPSSATFNGPISPVRRYNVGDNVKWGFDFGTADCGGPQTFDILSVGAAIAGDYPYQATITSVVPMGGGSDDCGNPLPIIPQGLPVPFTPPGPLSLPLPGGPIIVTPVITPVVISPNINFRPEINISIGPFDVKFMPDGIDININPSFNLPSIPPGTGSPQTPQLPPGSRPPVEPTPDEPECPDYSGEFAELNDKLDDLLDCDRCEKEYTLIPNGSSSGNANIVTGLMDDVVHATVNVTAAPVNTKTQSGAGAIDVKWLGWFWFLRDGRADERLPIDATTKTFTAPPGVNGYAYTLYVGCDGNATAYSRQEVIES